MEAEKPKESNNYSKLKWLKRIQEQSWEPEILISGIVLFALTQMPDLIREFFNYLDSYSFAIFSSGSADEALLAVLLTANYWLIAGFTTHLILRSVWIAFVGLSYVYRDGVNIERLNFREQFKRSLEKNTDYVKNILKLEKACSTVFAASFLVFMSTLGAFFFLSIVVVVIAIAFELAPDLTDRFDSYIDPFLSLIALVCLIDFIGLGVLKRIPYLSRAYYPLYRLISVLTLSPLYRNIYYGFISNHKKWKVGLAMGLFVAISFFIARSIRMDKQLFDAISLRVTNQDNQMLYHGHYDNLMGNEPSKRIQISSDVIDGNVLKVFVVMNAGIQERNIIEQCNYDSLKSIDGINIDSLSIACLSEFYDLKLNERVVEAEYHYHFKQKTNQEGIVTYLDISDLDRGFHELELIYNFSKGPRTYAVVEFFKESPSLIVDSVFTSAVLSPPDSVGTSDQD